MAERANKVKTGLMAATEPPHLEFGKPTEQGADSVVPHRIESVLLFDDDPVYTRIVRRFAEKDHLPLTAVETFDDFKKKWMRSAPDLVILDFDLEPSLVGPSVARLLGNTPVILISRKARSEGEGEPWTPNIKKFYHKKQGIPQLLSVVQSLVDSSSHIALINLNRSKMNE